MKMFVAIIISVVSLLAGVAISAAFAQDGDSQVFSPARFALVEANINVAMLQPGGSGSNQQRVLTRLDTRTGQVSILQLTVNGPGNPTVQSAVWAPVQAGGQYSISGR